MANEHFTFSEKIRSGSWSTAAWHALIRFLNDRFTAVETGFDGMPTEAEIATLTDIAAVTPADGTFLVGDGTDFVGESGSTVRTSAGLGASDNVTFATVTGTTSGTFGGAKIWRGADGSATSVFIGVGAGDNTTIGSRHNTVLGQSSGQALTTGLGNTIIGAAAGTALTTGSNNLILGYNAVASAVDVSNEITLGNASAVTFRIPGLSATSVDATKWGYVTGADQAVKKADTPQFAGIELGHASDTTLARSSAGNVTVEGNLIYRAGGTDVPVTDGGTGRSTSTTAYGLIAAGTTATGAHQTLSAGATTAVLVGGGSSALPVWTTATGSGAPVRATSPTLVTPTLGVASATSVNFGDTALSFYKEGTFTPELADAATGGSTAAVDSARGEYTRIGNVMTVIVTIENPVKTDLNAANQLFIRTLPYAAKSITGTNRFVGAVTVSGQLTFSGYLTADIVDGTDYIRLLEHTSGGYHAPLLVSALSGSDNTDIYLTITYMV